MSASRVISLAEMEIIIDGYNVIGSDAGLTGNLEHKRNTLVQQLAATIKTKAMVLRLFLMAGGPGRSTKFNKNAMEFASSIPAWERRRIA